SMDSTMGRAIDRSRGRTGFSFINVSFIVSPLNTLVWKEGKEPQAVVYAYHICDFGTEYFCKIRQRQEAVFLLSVVQKKPHNYQYDNCVAKRRATPEKSTQNFPKLL